MPILVWSFAKTSELGIHETGDTDQALRFLKESLEKRQETPEHADRDIDFDPIRDDPRFRALLEQHAGSC